MLGTGTISGPPADADGNHCGSMLEITWRGANPVKLAEVRRVRAFRASEGART